MSKLGLGLAAYGGYQARDRQIKAENYQDRQRDYGTAQMDANQAGLGDAAAARTAANQLSTAQSTAELGLVPKRADLASAQLGFQQETLPRQQETARKQVDMQGQQADQDYAMFGQKLRQQRIEGAITNQAAQTMAMHKLVDVIDTGAPSQVLDYFNSIVKAGALGDLPGPLADDVRMVNGPDGQQKIAILSGGKPIVALGAADMDRIRQMGTKYDYKVVGKSLIKTDARGNATPVFTSPEANKEGVNRDPAEVATMKYMVDSGIAKNPTDAFSKMRTARGKSKAEFIADMMKGSMLPGMGEDRIREQEGIFGGMYDRLNGGGRGAASNSNPANTLDPKVQSLFE
ncbi:MULTISPECIES: hypothetical protein [Cupriavidus]